ncbi:MAG TPA: Hsp20/alpha crystallin family protein [Pseudoxanthomonas sp.]|nr:Hsp20/alpha crystallin family protein [Pseudoxanthomonas sp.]
MNVRPLIPRNRERGLAARDERDPFVSLQRQMDRLFDGVMRQFDRPLVSRLGLDRDLDWPSVELTDADDALVLSAELPGMTEDQIEVLHDGDALLLRGERRDVRQDAARRYTERYYGRFERRIPLDVEIDWEQVRAEFRDGLLTVTLPRSARARAGRRIPINRAPAPAQGQEQAQAG